MCKRRSIPRALVYSITSSARSRIDGGTAKPSAVAALQNAMEIGGGATPDVYEIDSVGEQAAVSGNERGRINRRHIVSGSRRYDRRAMCERESTRYGEKPASRLAPKGDNGRFDFYVAMNGRNDWRELE